MKTTEAFEAWLKKMKKLAESGARCGNCGVPARGGGCGSYGPLPTPDLLCVGWEPADKVEEEGR